MAQLIFDALCKIFCNWPTVSRHLNIGSHDSPRFYWLTSDRFASKFGENTMNFLLKHCNVRCVPKYCLGFERQTHSLCVRLGRSENTKSSLASRKCGRCLTILCPTQIPLMLIVCNVTFCTVIPSRWSLFGPARVIILHVALFSDLRS